MMDMTEFEVNTGGMNAEPAEVKKDRRGGRREGAGRKPAYSKLMQFKAPKEMAAFIDTFENRSEYIKQCVAADMEARMKRSRRRKTVDVATVLARYGEVAEAESMPRWDVPFFENARVAAGFPIGGADTNYPQPMDVLGMLCPKGSQSYFVRVRGDSMVDAEIYDGDLVVIDASMYTRRDPDDILLCEVDGEYTIKRVAVRGNGRVFLVPANPNFPDIEVTGKELHIWGRVTACIHRL